MPDQQELLQRVLGGSAPDTSTVDQELRQLYGQALTRTGDPASPLSRLGQNLPTPTEVIGSPSLARDVEMLMSIAPFLRGSVKSVTSGPTGGVMWHIARNENLNRDANNFDHSNLLGQIDFKTREVALNPRLSWFEDPNTPASAGEEPSMRFATLAHEFGHAAGLNHSRELSNIEGVARMRDEFVRRKKDKSK